MEEISEQCLIKYSLGKSLLLLNTASEEQSRVIHQWGKTHAAATRRYYYYRLNVKIQLIALDWSNRSHPPRDSEMLQICSTPPHSTRGAQRGDSCKALICTRFPRHRRQESERVVMGTTKDGSQPCSTASETSGRNQSP